MSEPSSSPPQAPDDLITLVRDAQSGSQEAARLVFARYKAPLLGVIRRLIGRPLRRLYDSDDFLLSTFKEVFTKHFSDEVLRGPETLWPYLRRIAQNKVHDAERKYLVSPSHNLQRDVPLDDLDEEDEALCCKRITPEEELILKELVEDRLNNMLRKLPSLLQDIINLLLEGNSGIEIAVQLGLEPKRVYRAIDWLKRKVLQG
jgi:RNA polymerase sigma factor (sigma-70 family)